MRGIESVAKSYGLLSQCSGGWDTLMDKRIVSSFLATLLG